MPYSPDSCAKIQSKLRAKAMSGFHLSLKDKTMQAIRQGDVILLPVQQVEGKKLPHLILAAGEVTGHKHCITEGEAELSAIDGTIYLRVFSETALLNYEEHKARTIPQGH